MKKLINQKELVINDVVSTLDPYSVQTETTYYEGKEITIQIHDSSPESVSTIIDQKLPYLDLTDCELKMKEEDMLSQNDRLYALNTIEKSYNSTFYETSSTLLNGKGEIIDSSVCNNFTVKNPINIDSNSFNLQEYLDAKEKYGYDLFDPKDKFFTNICTPYDNKNGTDLTMEDRKLKFDKTLYCRSSTKDGIPEKIDENGYLSCVYENLPDKAKGGLETKIFDDLINGNYEVFLCIKLIFNEFTKNYGWFCFIGFTSISVITIVLHLFLFDVSKNSDKIFESDAITVVPLNMGLPDVNINTCGHHVDKFDSNSKIIHLELVNEENEIKKDKCSDRIKLIKFKTKMSHDNFKFNYNEDKKRNVNVNTSFTINSNEYFMKSPLNVGINDTNSHENESFNRENLNEEYLSINGHNNHITNNFVTSNYENKNKIYNGKLKDFSNKLNLENCISLYIESKVSSKKEKSCKFCDVDDTIVPKTLNDYSKLNENLELDRDNRNCFQYFWDDLKQSQNILNLIFITSIIQPFYIRMLMFSLSMSLEFFLNAFFFSFNSISNQTDYKIKNGKITIIWKILNELGQSIWPAIITCIIMGFINLFFSASEEDILELKKGLLLNDIKSRDNSM